MTDITYSSAVTLQENVLLFHAETMLVKQWIKGHQRAKRWVPWFMAAFLFGIAWLANMSFDKEMFLILTTVYLIVYIVFRFLVKKTIQDYEKDLCNGKSILTSTLVAKFHSSRYHVSRFTFVGPNRSKSIRINVDYSNYKRYSKGARLCVIFLPVSKVALNIIEV